MATFQAKILSGSTSGKPIPVAATATPGTLIHTAVAGADPNFDEITLFASNVTGTAATLTLEWGGVTDPGDLMTKAYSIPSNSARLLVVDRQRLNGGLVVRAFCGTANAINISGQADRIG